MRYVHLIRWLNIKYERIFCSLLISFLSPSEARKDIPQLAKYPRVLCVTPALSSRRQTLKFFRHSHATRVNERGELDSKGTMEQRNLRSQCQKYRKQKDYCYGDSLVTSSYKGLGTLGKFLLIFKMKTSVIGSVRQLRLVIFLYQILSTLTNLQRRRCPVSNQENLMRREI